MNLHGFITHSLLPAEAESFRPPYFVFCGDLFIFFFMRGGEEFGEIICDSLQRPAKQSRRRGQPAGAPRPLPAAGAWRGGPPGSPEPGQASGCRPGSPGLPGLAAGPRTGTRSPPPRPRLRIPAIFGVRREPVLTDLITA